MIFPLILTYVSVYQFDLSNVNANRLVSEAFSSVLHHHERRISMLFEHTRFVSPSCTCALKKIVCKIM